MRISTWKILISSVLMMMTWGHLTSQSLQPLKLFDQQGKKVSEKKLKKALLKADVVLFGEAHDISICHWLELEILKIMADGGPVVLGMEMFEADEQQALDQLGEGAFDIEELSQHVDVWTNFETDYLPLVEFSLDRKIQVVGTNAPQKIPRMIFRNGFEALDTISEDMKLHLPPLPIAYDPTLPGYKAMLEMSHGGMNTENFPKAQAIRDATMAHHIGNNLHHGRHLHINGSYHSDNFEGISWYLHRAHPNLEILTISTAVQTNIDQLEPDQKNKAHFIFCIPEAMPRTYLTSF